jgi:formylglycine-generating enzyme required for sulfatase activity
VKWLVTKTGKTYRLLSEAEFEYVARAGTKTPFWWGAFSTTDRANYNGSEASDSGRGEYRKKTMPVKSFQANPWGLYQVHGNVWTWTQDCWADSYNGAPPDGSAKAVKDCRRHILRGGAWNFGPALSRAASRYWYNAESRYSNFGVRPGT